MDIRKVKKLIELLEESNIDEIEIKEGEESVRISRNGAKALTMAARRRRCYRHHRQCPRRPSQRPLPRRHPRNLQRPATDTTCDHLWSALSTAHRPPRHPPLSR